MKSISNSLFCFALFLIIIGCSNPGYSVRINIDQDAKATDSDIDLIKSCMLQTTHEAVLKKGRDSWKIESYNIILDKDKFKQFEHKYIKFAVEYYYDQKVVGENIINRIKVRIGNSWEGRNLALKNEIDKIADCVLEQLEGRFDASKISIERRYTSPV